MLNLNSPLSLDSKNLAFKNIYFSTIQSLIIIATALIYHYNHVLEFSQNNLHSGLVILAFTALTLTFTYFFRVKKIQPKIWHYLIILSIVALVFNYESTVHAQILEGIGGAIDEVGTAAGGSFAADVLEAVISLIRIAVFIAVAGAVIAAIIFGVTQGQWQAPVLVVGVVVAIGLFLEIMGAVVFG